MKIVRWLGIAFLSSVALLATVVALAPTILSTSWGQKLCQRTASRIYPGSVGFKNLSIGWTSGIDVQGAFIQDPQGRPLFSCAQCTLERPLISLAFSRQDLGHIKVTSPVVYCYADKPAGPVLKKGSEHKERHNSKDRKESRPSSPPSPKVAPEKASWSQTLTPDLKAHLNVSDGQVIAVVDNHIVGGLSQGTLDIDLDLLHSSQGTFAGNFSHPSSKATPVSLSFTLDGAPKLSQMKGSFSLTCNHVPTELLAVLAQTIHPDIADFLKESFGSAVSYSVSASLTGPTITLHSALTSDNIRSDINVHVENDIVTVDKGELFSGTLSPHLFALLVNRATPHSGNAMTLLSPTVCSIENKTPLSFNLSEQKLTSPLDVQCSSHSPLQISLGGAQPPVSLSVATLLQGDPESPTASLQLVASSATHSGNVRASATGTKHGTGYHLTTQMNIDGQWPAITESITNIPVTSLFGPDLSWSMNAEGEFHNLDDFSFQGQETISSQNIQKKASFTCTQSLFSVTDASLSAQCPSSLVQKYVATPRFQNPHEMLHIQSKVKKLEIPLNHFIPVLQNAAIDAMAKVSVPTLLLQQDGGLTCSLASSDISITKEKTSSLAHFTLQTTTPVASASRPIVASLIGAPGAKLQMSGSYDLTLNSISVEKADLSAARLSAHIQDMNCAVTTPLSLNLSSPATARLSVDKEIVSKLTSSPLTQNLKDASDLTLTIKPFSISVADGQWHGSKIAVELRGENIGFVGKQPVGPYSLTVPASFDPSRRILTADPVITSGNETVLNGSATITFPEGDDMSFLEETKVDCSGEISQLPTALLDLISPHPLSPLLGESLSSTFSCRYNGLSAKGNRMTVQTSGAVWKANVDFALDAMHLSRGSSNAVDIEATISPSCFEALKALTGKKSVLTIGGDVTLHLTVPSCSADLSSLLSSPSKNFSLWELLDKSDLSTHLSVSQVHLQQQGATISRLSPLTATCDLNGKNHSLHFAVDSSGSSSHDAMNVTLKGSFDNVWNKDGLCLSSSHLRSSVDIDQFPTRAFDLILPQQGALMEEAIGKTIRIKGDFSADEMKSGSVKCDLQAKNCSMHLDGVIQNGTLTLKAPANASLAITKEAGTLLLKNVNPLLATAVRSDKPIQLTIDSQGAVIPLSPFSVANICLPKITVDVGKIVVKNGGALKIILALLNMGQAANREDLNVWLTPLYMRMSGGVVTCQRADALVADKLHMITWGDVDVGRDRINMVVAIPEESLKALKLQIVTTTPERGLQIPITGSSSNPKIDTTRATARLAGAGILNNAGDKRLQIFGGILQAAAATMGEPDQPIPAPTTQPFPWDR